MSGAPGVVFRRSVDLGHDGHDGCRKNMGDCEWEESVGKMSLCIFLSYNEEFSVVFGGFFMDFYRWNDHMEPVTYQVVPPCCKLIVTLL